MNICVDSGFILALYDKRDQHWKNASRVFDRYFDPAVSAHKFVFFWPILYELINTRFISRYIDQFNLLLRSLERRNQVILADDGPYRDGCFEVVRISADKGRSISLVDSIIREGLNDTRTKIGGLITFDPGHFSDACSKRGIRLLCQESPLT